MSLPIYPLNIRGLTWPTMKSHEFGTTIDPSLGDYSVRVANINNPIWHFALTYDYLKDDPTDIVAALSPHTDYRYLEGFLLSARGQFQEFLFDDVTDDMIGLNNEPGGDATHPSIFRPTNNPTGQWFYPAGSYVVDNNATPHLQKVTIGGIPGTTVPTFNTSGGTTVSGGITFTDQGVFSGVNAQQIPLILDSGNYYSPIQRNFGGQFLEDVSDLNATVYALKIWDNGTLKTAGVDYVLQGPGLFLPASNKVFQGMYVQWNVTPTGPITALAQFYFRVRCESDEQDIEQFMQKLWTVGGSASKNGSGILKLMSSPVDPRATSVGKVGPFAPVSGNCPASLASTAKSFTPRGFSHPVPETVAEFGIPWPDGNYVFVHKRGQPIAAWVGTKAIAIRFQGAFTVGAVSAPGDTGFEAVSCYYHLRAQHTTSDCGTSLAITQAGGCPSGYPPWYAIGTPTPCAYTDEIRPYDGQVINPNLLATTGTLDALPNYNFEDIGFDVVGTLADSTSYAFTDSVGSIGPYTFHGVIFPNTFTSGNIAAITEGGTVWFGEFTQTDGSTLILAVVCGAESGQQVPQVTGWQCVMYYFNGVNNGFMMVFAYEVC